MDSPWRAQIEASLNGLQNVVIHRSYPVPSFLPVPSWLYDEIKKLADEPQSGPRIVPAAPAHKDSE